MKQSVLQSLSEKDVVLIRETRRRVLSGLDEDALADLHRRVRRARNKHVTNFRRGAADRVSEVGSRGRARAANQRRRDRAEAFEDALARVSRSLARAARQSASALRDERLAAARKTGGSPRDAAGGRADQGTPADRDDDRRVVTPATEKQVAGSAAAGARRQVRKDSR